MDGLDTAGLFDLALDLQRSGLGIAPRQIRLHQSGIEAAPVQSERVPAEPQATADPEDENEADDRSGHPTPGLQGQEVQKGGPPHG